MREPVCTAPGCGRRATCFSNPAEPRDHCESHRGPDDVAGGADCELCGACATFRPPGPGMCLRCPRCKRRGDIEMILYVAEGTRVRIVRRP